MLTREQKSVEVGRLQEQIDRATAILIVDYRGLSVADANALRARLREAGDGGIAYRVTKNTLLRRAVAGTPVEPLRCYLTGPTAVATAREEPAALAKVLVDYAKENDRFEIKGGIIDGELVDLEAIRRVAALPSKQELRGMLAGTLQAPLRNLAGTLHALLGNLRNALERRAEQLETE